jgi:flagellar biosynthesis protein FlhF
VSEEDMKIRRYIAKNTQEAILKVKMDLGSEALILNTKKVRKKGIMGLFSKPMIEVLAAVDEYNGQKHENDAQKDQGQQLHSKTVEKTNFDEKEEKIANLENKISNIEDMLQKLYSQVKTEDKAFTGNGTEAKGRQNSRTAELFFNNLIKNEVDAQLARKLTDLAQARLGPNAGVNDMAMQLSGIISGLLGKPDTIKPGTEGKPTVVIFVGPTGVGKTTTLAKIAANYLLNQNKSIGLITADTYRIAAVEQLRTYAEILGIPVSVVYTPAEIKEAISTYSDKDIVLIDTAGRSHRDKAQFEELKAMITESDADEIYLVLSAATSMRSYREILDNYSFLKDYKLIFTKTDETPVMGIILNARYITGKSLSYITTGQSVPDDIETVNVDKITKNLIGSYTR